MNKNKVKNIALGVSLGLNILLGFFIGGGLIFSCTAKKAENSASCVSNDASGQIIDGLRNRALSARFAAEDEIDPADYENLWESSGTNYTFSTGHALFATETVGVFGYNPQENGRVEFNKINVAGLYYGAFTHTAGTWGGAFYLDRTNYTTIMQASPSSAGRANYKAEISESGSYFYVTQADVDAGAYVAFSQNGGFIPFIYLIDGSQLPSSEVVTFPREFFPWQIWGNRATDVLIGGPSVTSGTVAESQSLSFANLLFRCNGRVYKGITLVFSFRPGQHLGRYDTAGEIFSNGVIVYSASNPAWFLSGMLYIPAETGVDADRVLTANYAQLGDNTLLMPNPVWSKDVYRTIDILETSRASMSGVPSGVGTNTPMEWLNIIASAESIAPISAVGDPFTMLGNGFSAVANILSIPILPYLTLGTLLFVPLIVLVILAILRLLAK